MTHWVRESRNCPINTTKFLKVALINIYTLHGKTMSCLDILTKEARMDVLKTWYYFLQSISYFIPKCEQPQMSIRDNYKDWAWWAAVSYIIYIVKTVLQEDCINEHFFCMYYYILSVSFIIHKITGVNKS